MGSTEASESPVLGTLKAHKALPRRRFVVDDPKPGFAGRSKSPRYQNNQAAYTTSERIKSWIPEPASVQAVPAIGRPLTPPLIFRDNFKSWIDDAALKNGQYPPNIANAEGTTPPPQQSPPTPERSPPSAIPMTAVQTSAPSSHIVLDSRTESFRTACENISSEDGNDILDSPSLRPSRQEWLSSSATPKERRVGLGLGLESEEDDEPTPRRVTPDLDKKNQEFISFDGVWGGNLPDRIHNQMRDHTRKALKGALNETPLVSSDEIPKLLNQDDDGESGSTKDMSLREGLELDRHSQVSPSTQNFAEQIRWPSDDDIREVNEKRLSQASNNSTVVAAVVVGSPPRRRQTLRHTGKLLDINASDTTPTHSNRSSVTSAHQSLRRRDRNLRSPDKGLRSSYMAENPEAAATTTTKPRNDSFVVIPDRRSSLQSSTTSTKPLSKTFSLASRQLSSRPTTAPEETKSYFDVPRCERRTVSVVIQQARPLKREEGSDKELASPPAIQISPTSVPTSSGISTTSATSGGVITHYFPASPSAQGNGTVSSPDPQEAQDPTTDPAVTGDWSAFRPGSALVTPFSLRSAHSSTPGTLEVKEATALSIHPHNNHSILVIQEIASKDKSKPVEQSAVIASNASIAIPGNMTPVVHQETPPRQLTESPLQNPRDPPEPPAFIKVIPPTPGNAPYMSEDARIGRSASTRTQRTSAPLSSIKRAFSARRHSDSFRSPLFKAQSLRNPMMRQRFSFSENDERENRLHPLWRPRRLFEKGDTSDSESDFGNNGILSPKRARSQIRSSRTMSLTNRITGSLRSASLRRPQRASSISALSRGKSQPLPSEVVDKAIKKSQPLGRRLTGSLKLPRPRGSTAASWANQPHYDFAHAENGNAGAKDAKDANGVPGQGYPVQFVGFRGWVDKLERRREMREEGRREARRDWLRGRIDYVVPDGDEKKKKKKKRQRETIRGEGDEKEAVKCLQGDSRPVASQTYRVGGGRGE